MEKRVQRFHMQCPPQASIRTTASTAIEPHLSQKATCSQLHAAHSLREAVRPSASLCHQALFQPDGGSSLHCNPHLPCAALELQQPAWDSPTAQGSTMQAADALRASAAFVEVCCSHSTLLKASVTYVRLQHSFRLHFQSQNCFAGLWKCGVLQKRHCMALASSTCSREGGARAHCCQRYQTFTLGSEATATPSRTCSRYQPLRPDSPARSHAGTCARDPARQYRRIPGAFVQIIGTDRQRSRYGGHRL